MNRLAEAVSKRRLANLEILELHSGDHDFASSLFPASILQGSFTKFAQNLGYKPHPRGSPEARRAISDFYRTSFDYPISPDQIILTSGSSESYAWLFRILALTGSETILAPIPTYPLFEHIADFSRIKLVYDSGISEAGVGNLPGSASGHACVLAVSPGNPSGEILDAVQLRQLENRSDAIIFDEVFSSFIWNPDLAGANFPRPCTSDLRFTLNGVSKLLALPWLKLSWILVEGQPSRVVDALDSLEFLADTFLPVNSFAQFALPDLFLAREEFFRAYLEFLDQQRLKMLETIASIPGFHGKAPDGGLTVVVTYDARIGMDEEEFAIRLLEETGVHVYPGYYFEIEGGRSFVMSFQQRPDVLSEALGRLFQFALQMSVN